MSSAYSGKRKLADIKKACLRKGWLWDQSKYDNTGSDYVTFGFQFRRLKLIVLYNTVNGRFIVDFKNRMITEESVDLDTVDWYKALLDFIYIPAQKKAA